MTRTDSWWHDGAIYQIYPRSFADSNNDGVGDLKGIIGKLDYLADLGITGLWLSPINPSPDVDFGYDVSDYKGIDPKFGSLADFSTLIKEAHKRNIHIVLDLVLNHTSDQHRWFLEAKKSRENPYHDWYIWHDPVPGRQFPNNWRSIFGGAGWEYVPEVDQYYYHMFTKEQPDLNWRNPNVYAEMLDTFRYWIKRGVDGFRLDVFNEYYKDSQFRDNPVNRPGIRKFERQTHMYDTEQPEMMAAVADIRKVLDEFPGSYAVGESFMIGPQRAAEYAGSGMLHSTFDFGLLTRRWSAGKFLSVIARWENALAGRAWGTYVISNHDTPRPATRFTLSKRDDRLKTLAAMLFTMHGTPYMYYGDEIGMRDLRVKRSEIMDPVGGRYWPAPVGRDGCRSPMQWDKTVNAGFGSGKPWLRVNPNYLERNVETQEKDSDSILSFYKQMIKIRKDHPVLVDGMFLPLTTDPIFLLAYLRKNQEDTILVALNFSRRKMKLFLGRDLAEQKWELLLSTKRKDLPDISMEYIQLKGDEALIMKLKKDTPE